MLSSPTNNDACAYAPSSTPKAGAPPIAKTPAMVSVAKLFSFADTTDKVLVTLGTLSAMTTGVLQCIQIVFFGDALNAVGPNRLSDDSDTFRSGIRRVVIQFAAVAAIALLCGLAQIACFSIAAARQTKRLRHAYASAILRQEVGWFDVNDPMQLATRVADTTLIIQEGLGRKVADAINFSTMGLTGVIISLVYGWELALVLLAVSPLVAGSGYWMIKAITAATQAGVDAYAEAGGIAQEALSNIL
ncbi:hypothetical protein SDRG_12409 [Saprolegnia diclina VS20]|uniref:ABC transmembrane type-1 domain-containing protein n=1 Tax=Saprolegnia diclina (strain VS20) TaxID=1156394 RepID=T0Q8R4_SAPDV|nr:hypothetical protein SDRG_12409 [Saprolegnia diclina VS20]EQC29865.1 hypothetical protein SDRG_12409 [Saprolegnia diclina VS20]|eukprot:XP_008616704.1 hypothetical protein SDRG_12409 [Saprolegnia diclina VS20]